MKKGKGVIIGVLILLVVVVLIVNVNAGFLDFVFGDKEAAGEEGELRQEPVDVTIEMSNAAPFIAAWIEPDADLGTAGIQPFVPTSCTTTSVTFVVTMYDDNGWNDLSGGVVSAEISKGGTTRSGSCVAQVTGSGKYLDFDCTVNMQYYDEFASDWVISITATDGSDPATNSPRASQAGVDDYPPPSGDGTEDYPFFTYASTLYISVDDSVAGAPSSTLEWTGVTASSVNKVADNNLVVENCGNIEITASGTSWLSVFGKDLESATDPVTNTDVIEPDSFRVDEASPACPNPAGTRLPKAVALDIPDATLLVGSGSTRELYFCIEGINPTGSSVRADNYKTKDDPNNWELDASE